MTEITRVAVLPAVWMKEVPKEILDGVYEKWAEALKDGWNEEQLWNGCDLCEWLDLIHDGCNRCPLREDDWCNNGGQWSKLHITYSDDDSEDPELLWVDRVKAFLVFLKPYCSEE
jgi:hypothetical protein